VIDVLPGFLLTMAFRKQDADCEWLRRFVLCGAADGRQEKGRCCELADA
jgi:hypothetical protein